MECVAGIRAETLRLSTFPQSSTGPQLHELHDVLWAAEGREAFDAGEDLGDYRNDFDARVVLFQAAARAREGSACAHADDEMGPEPDPRRERGAVGEP